MPLPASDERLIERYVIGDDSISAAEREHLRELLEESAEARALRAEFERFYFEFEAEADTARDAVDSFVADLGFSESPRGPVRLHPIRHTIPPGPTVLAAKSATRARPRFEPVAVLGDRQQGVIFRMLRDNESGHILAFLIGKPFGPSVLELPGLGTDIVIGSDGRGRASSLRPVDDWDSVTAVWHPASAVLQMSEAGETGRNGFGVRLSGEQGRYRLEARGVGRSLVIEHEGGSLHLRSDGADRIEADPVAIRLPASFAFCP